MRVIGIELFANLDEEGISLEEFVNYVRGMTRNGLFDQYQEHLDK